MCLFAALLLATLLLFAFEVASAEVSAKGPSVVVDDKFNERDAGDRDDDDEGRPLLAVPLEDHQPNRDAVGNGWQIAGGQWFVDRGNASDITAQNTPYIAVVDSEVFDIDLSVAITWQQSSEAGLIFRYQNADNWFGLIYDGKRLSLRKKINGEVTTLARRSVRWKPGQTKVMSVTVSGEEIIGALEGLNKRVRSSDLDLQFKSRVGLYYLRDSQTRADRFTVRSDDEQIDPGVLVFPSSAESVVFDQFDDSGSLDAHDPDKAPLFASWTEVGGDWELDGDSASEITGFGFQDNRAIIETGIAESDVFAEMTRGAGADRFGVVFRYEDEFNWYMAWFDGQTAFLGKNIGGVFRLLRASPFEWGPEGTSRLVRVRSDATTVRVYIDETLPFFVANETDLNDASKAGLFARSGPPSQFERFAVRPAAALPLPDLPFPPLDPPPTKDDPPDPPAGATLYDSYTDFVATPLTIHAPDVAPGGASWEIGNGLWFDWRNIAIELSGGLADRRASIETGVDEGTVSAKIRWDRDITGIVFRYRNENNWAMFWYDGTGDIVASAQAKDPRIQLIRREAKLGLGTAYLAGFRRGLDCGYDYIFTMDADRSHHPRYLPAMLESLERDDMVVGSRYVPGGGIENWPIHRRALSKFANFYTRTLLRISVNDCTSPFLLYLRDVLETVQPF
ncbi:MAG: glycosyltransferase, partial [Chloroflexi bacterium]|nr:glycosyltransferase [Chloroflexota bacterium]